MEYLKYSSFIKLFMPTSVELNNWVHANKEDLPHVTCLQHDIKQESSLADEKCLQKYFFIGLVFFAYKNDVTCWTSYEEMQISLPAYTLFYIIPLWFCKKLFSKTYNKSENLRSKLPCYHFVQPTNENICPLLSKPLVHKTRCNWEPWPLMINCLSNFVKHFAYCTM